MSTPSARQTVKAGDVDHIQLCRQGLCYHGKEFGLHTEFNGAVRVLSWGVTGLYLKLIMIEPEKYLRF